MCSDEVNIHDEYNPQIEPISSKPPKLNYYNSQLTSDFKMFLKLVTVGIQTNRECNN